MDELIRKKPKNPIKILLERFPGNVAFQKFVYDSRASIDVVVGGSVGAGMRFRGIGPNKKVAREAAAKCAIRELKRRGKF
jgi:hypothetical protein